MSYYCDICDKSKNHKSKNRHNRTKRHYLMKKHVTNFSNYKDIFWDDVEKILHENNFSHNNNFNEYNFMCHLK